jgi:hypothetical protein
MCFRHVTEPATLTNLCVSAPGPRAPCPTKTVKAAKIEGAELRHSAARHVPRGEEAVHYGV